MRMKVIITLALFSLTGFILFTMGCGGGNTPSKIANLAITKFEIYPQQPHEYQKFSLYLDISNTGSAKSDSIEVRVYFRKVNQDFILKLKKSFLVKEWTLVILSMYALNTTANGSCRLPALTS